ncbi:MAG: WG repeat-containing protein [Clostridia bacterium]|nr:WG repeat-containing protein [Clostridia bacterium]
MRGKLVNLCIGLMNVLFGILIIVFTKNVPLDKTLITVQENYVISCVLIGIYAVMGTISIIDAIQSYHHRTDSTFNTAYVIGVFSLSFIFIKQPAIAAFSIISGIIVLFKSLKENLIELNSTAAISVSIVVMAATGILGVVAMNYEAIGESIKNKENKNEISYKSDYFKYITELGEPFNTSYINVKKDGKWGYINSYGECMIEFIYDYASPFVEIEEYGKKFHIAFVCEDGSTKVILKNGRVVLSYRTESSDENYKVKLEELENIYTNILGQKGKMTFEIPEITNNINKVPAYYEVSSEYSFKYDYNEEYDLLVTQSNMGLGDTYELAKKAEPEIKIRLDTTYLDYDSSYLYLYSNGNIPFYEISKRTQGWYTPYGKKNEMTGKAQILDFFGDDRILLKNYNDGTIYFSDTQGKKLSETYTDIYVCPDGRYIVGDKEGYFKFIDDSYNQVFENKYAAVNTRLVSQNLYLVMDSTDGIKTNDYNVAKTNWNLMNQNGEIILEGIEQIYDLIFEVDTTGSKDENYQKLKMDLKDLKYSFVGDKFYLDY